jgi:hypothetical protein
MGLSGAKLTEPYTYKVSVLTTSLVYLCTCSPIDRALVNLVRAGMFVAMVGITHRYCWHC